MARKQHKPSRGKRKHIPWRRAERLARQLVIYGWRQEPGTDLVGGVHRPVTMRSDTCTEAYNWAIHTPVRWWVRAIVICRDERNQEYRETVEAEIGQAVLINDTSDFRISLLEQARNSVNPRHWVAEGFEMGVI